MCSYISLALAYRFSFSVYLYLMNHVKKNLKRKVKDNCEIQLFNAYSAQLELNGAKTDKSVL